MQNLDVKKEIIYIYISEIFSGWKLQEYFAIHCIKVLGK